ncbi:uncharacterized protein METZ01_LOCUS429461, partial [marine metagenome]
ERKSALAWPTGIRSKSGCSGGTGQRPTATGCRYSRCQRYSRTCRCDD